jgi:exopolysaccharide biosynthesis polyprenyl glycosylphosphotransferase
MIRLRNFLIFILDILIFWAALALTLFIRYGPNFFWSSFLNHLPLFAILLIFWIAIFYLADLYQLKIFKQKIILLERLFLALTISVLFSIIFLYLFGPFFQLAPKTNLLLFSIIFFSLAYFHRLFLNQIFYLKRKIPILFLGEAPTILDLISDLKSNPQLGFEVIALPKEIDFENLKSLFLKEKIETVIISPALGKKEAFIKLIYYFLPLGIEVIDFRDFYEMIYQKEPLDLLDEAWFIEKLKSHRLLNFLKRIFDLSLSFTSLFFFSPLILLGAFLVKISSPGSVFLKQRVVGRNNENFILYKLRTMKEGNKFPLWTIPGDKRVTKIGKFLRSTHLDELPQLYNILKGDLSFVGPRPERIELVKIFEEKLPYYNIRHIIRPGLTGWAQINYKPSASIREASEKFKYDLYYIKNRSFWLDLLILFKTIKLLFITPK